METRARARAQGLGLTATHILRPTSRSVLYFDCHLSQVRLKSRLGSIGKQPDLSPTSSLRFCLLETQNPSVTANYLSLTTLLMPTVKRSSSGKHVARLWKESWVEESPRER